MPIFLLLISYFFLEIYVLIKIWGHYGFINTVFALIAIGILGAGFARNQGRYILKQLQHTMARGQVPTDEVLHGVMIFIAGILFLIPGFVSDFIGLILVLPGLRHLMVANVRRQMANRVARGMNQGGFRVFTYGMGGMGQPGSRPGTRQTEPGAPPEGWMRDASPKVIDVTPLSAETHEKPDKKS